MFNIFDEDSEAFFWQHTISRPMNYFRSIKSATAQILMTNLFVPLFTTRLKLKCCEWRRCLNFLQCFLMEKFSFLYSAQLKGEKTETNPFLINYIVLSWKIFMKTRGNSCCSLSHFYDKRSRDTLKFLITARAALNVSSSHGKKQFFLYFSTRKTRRKFSAPFQCRRLRKHRIIVYKHSTRD